MMRCSPLPLVAVLAALAASVALAQPSPRGFVEMAYDSESELFVLFGGSTGDYRDGGDVNGETWVLDPATVTWELRSPEPAPPPLIGANLVYDAESDRVVLWGGDGPGFAHSTELWSYDVDADAWTRHEPADGTVPPGRFGARMVYHPGADRIVLFGGFSIPDDARLDDTWILDLDSAAWTRLEPAASPDARYVHQMAYDPVDETIVLWGGDVVSSYDHQVWRLDVDAGTWTATEAPAEAPWPRSHAALVTLGDRGEMLFVGGVEVPGNVETWLYTPSEHAWRQLDVEGVGPLSRFAAAHAPGHGAFVFGGQLGNTEYDYVNDTWRFDPDEGAWSRP